MKYDGLPPLDPETSTKGTVVFANVSDVYIRSGSSLERVFTATSTENPGAVVVQEGKVVCMGLEWACLVGDIRENAIVRDLEGGSVASVISVSLLAVF